MTCIKRIRQVRLWLLAFTVLAVTGGTAAEPILYRGDYEYVVPEPMADKMTELSAREDWTFFSQFTRYVDADDDGISDYIAIALGAADGYGGQIRYRLTYPEGGAEPEIGPWYWCVITDETGQKIFEQFNP